MEGEDRHRYFIVESVMLDIVQPLFRTRLENGYISNGQASLQAFLNTLPVIHILFHLRHRNAHCCKDNWNCFNNSKLPLLYCQWNLLYTENPGQRGHNCHCKFIANPVQLNELDTTLAYLILFNCCHLTPSEKIAVCKLHRFKNDYLSHNTEGKITETEYKTLLTDLNNLVLQLDPNKKDDLILIRNRFLDAGLFSRNSTYHMNIHKKLNEEILIYTRKEVRCQPIKNNLIEQGMDDRNINTYILGQDIFYLHHQISVDDLGGQISDVVMMDDGRLVMCLFEQSKFLITNTDGLQVATIPVGGTPYSVTAVTNSTVAVVVYQSFSDPQIEMYDINSLLKLNSVPLHTIVRNCDITMINDKLVVGVNKTLMIVAYQTGEIVQNIETHCQPWGIHAWGHKIFYRERMSGNNNLYWYSFADDKIHTLTLPSIPCSMTTLHDGSLYVLCTDESVQHVSSNGIHFKTLKGNQSQFFNDYGWIRYNSKQKKMITLSVKTGNVKIFKEI